MNRRKRDIRRRATAQSPGSDSDASNGWSPRAARPPIERAEKLAIGVLFVAAVALRFSYQARISIEHWDEAVNASNIFLEGGYPNRFLYSPPLVPLLIEISMLLLGKTPLAAVMPSLMLGSLTVPLCWWVGREWFGPIAGIAAAALAAFSDFQIVYSRTGLTDAALGFWFLLAVYCSWRALARNRLGEALVAGLVIACAWATKYNGWLPLAVALSAFIAWGVCERFGRADWTARLPVVATLVIATLLGWSPVWLSLQPDGGYSAVTANHAQYFFGLSSWWDDFKRQLANQRFYEGWLTAAGMMLAWLLPVIIERSAKARPTQDTDIAPGAESGTANVTGGVGSRSSADVVREFARRIHLLTIAALLAGVSLLVGWLGFTAVFGCLFIAFAILVTVLPPRSAAVDPEAARAQFGRLVAGRLVPGAPCRSSALQAVSAPGDALARLRLDGVGRVHRHVDESGGRPLGRARFRSDDALSLRLEDRGGFGRSDRRLRLRGLFADELGPRTRHPGLAGSHDPREHCEAGRPVRPQAGTRQAAVPRLRGAVSVLRSGGGGFQSAAAVGG